MRPRHTHTWSPPRAACTALAALGVIGSLASCGGEDTYRNTDRPPSPIVLTATITKQEVTVSPRSFGAGPVSLVIANETQAAQQVTFESAGQDKGFRSRTAPINPSDTATLKVDVPEGRAVVRVAGDSIRQARVRAGAERASAQDDLLQP